MNPAASQPSHPGLFRLGVWLFLGLLLGAVPGASAASLAVLKTANFSHYVEKFNAMEDENVTNTIPNAAAWTWLQKEIPFFECPDQEVEEMYYFRWWSFRKHLVQTPGGWVITEFLTPVRHAGSYNTVSCAAGFHIAEGRWLHDPKYLNDYAMFWLRGHAGKPQPHFHKFSSWFANALLGRCLVNGDQRFVTGLLPDLIADYQLWETERMATNGLFWQFDVRDGMEESISGSRTQQNFRPTINSYMFGNATAIAAIARMKGDQRIAGQFDARARNLQKRVQAGLWNEQDDFFEVRYPDGSFSNVREELGYVPWMFNLPQTNANYAVAWTELTNAAGFDAPAGLTTAERRHPQFRSHGVGTCEWDGAVWPFATSQTLYAWANVLRDNHSAAPVSAGGDGRNVGATTFTARNYFDAFLTYTRSQHDHGKPYIGEYLDETTGDWINGKGGRSRYYNHSTYADLLITGVVGLQPQADNLLEVAPLLPDGTWKYFCLDGISYHGQTLTILWDEDGTRYGRGRGLAVLVNGKEIARREKLTRLLGKLP